jgi:NAD(P)H-hydrate epimerase
MNHNFKPIISKIYPRKLDTHKGDYGKVFVIAGSIGMTGAASLTSLSALRIGAGMVGLGIPESLNQILEAKLTEVITYPLEETNDVSIDLKAYDRILKLIDKYDILAIGPGVSLNKSTQELIRKIVVEINKPIILDADGLNAFVGNLDDLKNKKTNSLIITPHLKEFSRLFEISADELRKKREDLTRQVSSEYNMTTVLKGYRTIVASSLKIYVNDTGNPGMATAGSGDVLTGIIAGLRAQGLDDFESASLGVWLHGKAGDLAKEEKGEMSIIASDILENLNLAIRKLIL